MYVLSNTGMCQLSSINMIFLWVTYVKYMAQISFIPIMVLLKMSANVT